MATPFQATNSCAPEWVIVAGTGSATVTESACDRRATEREPVALTVLQPRDAGYDLLLLGHVLAALVSLGAVVTAGGFALSLRRSAVAGGPTDEGLVRYYRPGVNWAGRALFLVPVLGFALMGLSHGDWTLADGWISAGLVLWAGVAVVAEAVLWPAERRLQEIVSRHTAAPEPAAREEDDEAAPLCSRVAVVSAVLSLVLVATAVVMVAKP